MLRASHIVPWKSCKDDAHRLDVHNGVLLSALWDAAFDRVMVTFGEGGQQVFSTRISKAARGQLLCSEPLQVTEAINENMVWHRKFVFEDS